MKIGYARTSTIDQVAGLEAQVRQLEEVGCDRVYREQQSSVAARPQMDMLIDHVLHPGDELVATRIDRLARSVRDLVGIVDRVHGRGARLNVLSLGSIDPATTTGALMLSILGAIAEFERAIMLERQREGIAAAKAEGKYKGRIPTVRRRAVEIHQLHAQGLGAAEIARQIGCARQSVWRVLKSPLNPG